MGDKNARCGVLQGITKLVTLEAIPEQWPENVLIRMAVDAQTLADAALPSNVVATKPIVNEQEAIDAIKNDDLLRGLPEILAQLGLDQDEQKEAVTIAQRLRLSV